MRIPSRFRAVAYFSLFCLASASLDAQAAELRWKFSKGDVRRYRVDQSMSMTMTLNDRPFKTEVSQIIDLTWIVREQEGENATLSQSYDRIRFVLDAPNVSIEYDSKDEEKPTGNDAAMLGEMLDRMVGVEFVMQIDPRGQIGKVEVPKEIIEAMQANPMLRQMGGMFTEKGMKEMFKQSMIVFPEESLEIGDEWTDSLEIEQSFGKQKMDITTTYQGMVSQDGTDFARLTRNLDIEMEPAPNSPISIEIVEKDVEAEILFDPEIGQLIESDLNQRMSMRVTGPNGQAIDQTIESRLRMSPAE